MSLKRVFWDEDINYWQPWAGLIVGAISALLGFGFAEILNFINGR